MQDAQISNQQHGVFGILELIQCIGNILHPSDLFACIQEPEYEWIEDLDRQEQDEMIALRWELAMEDLSVCPFPTRKEPFGRTLAQQELDWSTSKHFWTFIRNNRQLQSLYLHKSLGEFMEDVPLPYLVDTLASLKDLALLENNYVAIDLDHIFGRLLGLEQYSTAFSPSGSGASIQPSLRLRDAKFLDVCTYRELLWILNHAPNLESLSFGAVSVLGTVTPTEAAVIMDNTLSRVTSLQLGVRTHMLDVALDQVFALMPNLTSFTTTQLVPSIAQALSTFCTNLETVHEPYKGSLSTGLSQALDWLLKNCPTLTKFDGVRHVLSGSIWEEPWVCQELTFLRCQVKGVQRLSSQDQERYSVIVCGSLSEDDVRLLQLRRTSLQQQKKIYRKLATLTQLRVLDLGLEYRRLYRGLQMSDEQYLTVDGLFPDTLELTLESGLGKLETLKALQVFGFEGVDHRIGLTELEWMAKKWTGLEEMRGLHKFSARIEYKRRKDELRNHFEGLRPDVKHQGADYGYDNGAGWL
ncbi:hypothetical protein KI688_005250 [Linnemannia hyalina]|uniref:Uncharacterized protein n=1 Tax=Linnemannia hyalina TaxID=64524 RepID=A0A9P8BNK6_9FUNG|nr:hypothetical protein KI688_005250 [Linnemannia hyalina]